MVSTGLHSRYLIRTPGPTRGKNHLFTRKKYIQAITQSCASKVPVDTVGASPVLFTYLKKGYHNSGYKRCIGRTTLLSAQTTVSVVA